MFYKNSVMFQIFIKLSTKFATCLKFHNKLKLALMYVLQFFKTK